MKRIWRKMKEIWWDFWEGIRDMLVLLTLILKGGWENLRLAAGLRDTGCD